MQIGNTKYSIGTRNWKQRTPLMLKFICDILLFLSLVTANLPEISNPEIGKWILTGGVIAKLLSNFISEHMPVQVQETIKTDAELPAQE
jgi:hypothetical protein